MTRNRQDVEHRLTTAAAELLGELGPRAMTIRQIAERAGVNHGLVHHYFGGKDGLLRAAMTQLVEEHARYAKEQSAGDPIPAPLALRGDQRYLRAVVRCVLDGDMDLALMEVTAGVSVPRGALEHVTAARGLTGADQRLKAMVALGMAMEMGWAALEPFLFAVTDIGDDDADAVRDIVREFRRTFAAGLA